MTDKEVIDLLTVTGHMACPHGKPRESRQAKDAKDAGLTAGRDRPWLRPGRPFMGYRQAGGSSPAGATLHGES